MNDSYYLVNMAKIDNGIFRLVGSHINSLRLGDAYVHKWTASQLVQLMVCDLLDVKPSPEVMISYRLLDSREQISVNIQSNYTTFCQENASANVAYKMLVKFVLASMWYLTTLGVMLREMLYLWISLLL